MRIKRGPFAPDLLHVDQTGIKNILSAAVELYGDDGERRPEPLFHQFPSPALLYRKRVLIVDEVWDSGRTIEAVTRRVREAGGVFTDLSGLPVGLETKSVLAATPELHAQTIAAAVPAARYHELAGQTHNVKPEVLTPAVVEFLAASTAAMPSRV